MHEFIHSGCKQHACKNCGKPFTVTGDLKMHEFIHSGYKQHTYKNCCKPFAVTGDLKMHECIHSIYKQHVCKKCVKSFTVTGNLKMHYEFIHSGSGRPLRPCSVARKQAVILTAGRKNMSFCYKLGAHLALTLSFWGVPWAPWRPT